MLSDTVNTYLSVRRAVGFKLKTIEKYLASYASFAAARGDLRVVSKTALEWAALGASKTQRANRLNVLIRFARFARAEDSGHEIPPESGFCGYWPRRSPYLFTDDEVRRLIFHAGRLGPPGELRPYTYSTLFGLLASTGLRISDALSLHLHDVTSEGLVIRETKFRKSRLVWLHETAAVALQHYLLRRRKFASGDERIVISRRGGKLGYAVAADTFQEVLKAAGIQRQPDGPQPRLHDLRQNAEARKMPNEGVCTVFAAQLLTAGSALFDVFSSPVEARRYDYERNIQISECGPSPPRRSAWYPCGCV
jgi:integrase/recombinase XerD